MPDIIKSVCICTVGELFGGVERHVLGILPTLRERGIDAQLCVFHNGELAEQARHLGFEPTILSNSNSRILATAMRMAAQWRHQRCQIVHTHGYKAMLFSAFGHAFYRTPIVKTEHGLPEIPTGNFSARLRTQAYHLFDRLAVRATRASVCYVTQDLADHHARDHSGLLRRVIPNGVETMDKAQFQRPAEFLEQRFNLAIIGRLEAVKGIDRAIKALANPHTPDAVHLHILGTGPLEPELRALASTAGVAAKVHFLGFKRHIYPYIAHCDALLMPSLHEGLPYTLLEAMALAVPIIAAPVGGLAETLTDDVSALLIDTARTDTFAAAIARLYHDPGLRHRLGSGARAQQQSIYSIGAMTDRYLDLYKQLLGDYAR